MSCKGSIILVSWCTKFDYCLSLIILSIHSYPRAAVGLQVQVAFQKEVVLYTFKTNVTGS